MKIYLTLILFLAIACNKNEQPKSNLAATSTFENRGCSGDTYCSACKNCSGCKHCAKEGGTCGVCSQPIKKTKTTKKTKDKK